MLYQPIGWKNTIWKIPGSNTVTLIPNNSYGRGYSIRIEKSIGGVIDGVYSSEEGIKKIQLIIQNQFDKLYKNEKIRY